MKNLKLPANYTPVAPAEQHRLAGGCLVSGSLRAAAQFVFPEKEIAGESRTGYYPTFILVPEAVFLDYAALRVSNFLFRTAAFLDSIGL